MPPLKLFFDECCSPRLPRKLVEIYIEDYPGIQTQHLTDLFKGGTDDADWLKTLEQDKDWVVITADRGRDSKRPKLPIVCSALGITHISMTPALQEAGYSEHKQAMLCVWPQIVKVPFIPKGTKVSLGYHMVNKGATKIHSLSVSQKAFDLWCREKSIVFPDRFSN